MVLTYHSTYFVMDGHMHWMEIHFTLHISLLETRLSSMDETIKACDGSPTNGRNDSIDKKKFVNQSSEEFDGIV